MLRQVREPLISVRPKAPRAKKLPVNLTASDRIAGIALRWAIGRDKARVPCGLYYAGNPGADSPILVTANYRLTFDSVRKELSDLSVWLLVIDTKGINVWCAAGKRTFCAGEIVAKIKEHQVDRFSPKGMLVLPQLSASGVNAIELAKKTGRTVRFGPVFAKDIKEYIASGMNKTERMKTVTFTFRERLSIVPVELVHAWPLYPLFAILAFLLALPANALFIQRFIALAVLLEGSILCGTAAFPLLLPYLPFRFFSLKGGILNLAVSGCAVACLSATQESLPVPALASAILAGTAAAAYLAMNYTGASTFTCQKGAELEVKRSIGPIIIAMAFALILALIHSIRLLAAEGVAV